MSNKPGNDDYSLPEVIKNCALTWLVPGLGYWLLGRRKAGMIVSGGLLAALLMGLLLGGDLFPLSNVEGTLRRVGAFCQMGMGFPFFVGKLFLDRGTPLSQTYDYGTNYFLIAGMLNWLAVLDVFDITVKRK